MVHRSTCERPADASTRCSSTRRRSPKRRAVTWTVLTAGIATLGTESVLARHEIGAAGQAAVRANAIWVAVAISAALLSMHCFGRLQRHMLLVATGPGEVRPSVHEMVALSYSANALNTLAPAGGPVSAAFVMQRLQARGVRTTAAAFALLASGVLSSITFSLLAAACALLGASSPAGAVTGVLAIVMGGLLLAAVGRRWLDRVVTRVHGPGRVLQSTLGWGLRLVARISDRAAVALSDAAAQLRTVHPSRRDWAAGALLSTGNWVADLLCLTAACQAIGLRPGSFALPLIAAYLAGMSASSLAFLPGGFGVIEVTMIAALHAAGVPTSAATAAVLLYRAISCVLVVALGCVMWLVAAASPRNDFLPIAVEVSEHVTS